MTYTAIAALATTSAVCSGVAGGVYLAFSAIVMPALRTLPAREATAAMQGINVSAVRLPFMAVFFGGTAASAALVIAEFTSDSLNPASASRVAGAGLALASFGITIVRNVPLNNALAGLAPDADAADSWARFDRPWSAANHVRGAAAITAAVLLCVSLINDATS